MSAESSINAPTVYTDQGVFCTDQGWDAGGGGSRNPALCPQEPVAQQSLTAWGRCVGHTCCVRWADPLPPQDPPCRGSLRSDRRWTRSSWPSALRLPPGSGPADSPGGAREGRGRRVEGSADHIATASPAPQPQTLPVLCSELWMLSRTIHRGGCPGPCWTSPLGWAGWMGGFQPHQQS